MLLEALNSDEILKKNTKIVHIIDFKKLKELNVGRGHDNNVRITDISISRLHCKLYCQKGQIYIDDQGSKFGTLVAVKNALDLNQCSPNTYIQIARSLFIMNVKKPTKLCCKLVKPAGLTSGFSYIPNAGTFSSIFKKYCKTMNLRDRKST